MIYAVLCRPDLDKDLATKVSFWLHSNAKRDLHGARDVEFYIWQDHRWDDDEPDA